MASITIATIQRNHTTCCAPTLCTKILFADFLSTCSFPNNACSNLKIPFFWSFRKTRAHAMSDPLPEADGGEHQIAGGNDGPPQGNFLPSQEFSAPHC
jgi:hypothetical protein